MLKDPNALTCRNPECEHYLVKNINNICIKEFKGKNHYALFKCKNCGKCFSETARTPFFGLKTSVDEIARTLLLIPKLGSIRAVARYTKHKPDTIIKWIDLLRNNKKEITHYFIKYYHYSMNQIEEIWTAIERRKRNKKKN